MMLFTLHTDRVQSSASIMMLFTFHTDRVQSSASTMMLFTLHTDHAQSSYTLNTIRMVSKMMVDDHQNGQQDDGG